MSTKEAVFYSVGLEKEVSHLYPFELSGGMARRVLAATAMVSGAEFIIADEPTPGLDPQSLQETITYLKKLADEGKGIMFITHDIETAIKVANKVAVFYAGHTVEIANAEDFSGAGEKLRHPYTKALWKALPQNEFTPLAGSQPLPDEMMRGCPFYPRCPLRMDLCRREQPESKVVNDGMVRCFYA